MYHVFNQDVPFDSRDMRICNYLFKYQSMEDFMSIFSL